MRRMDRYENSSKELRASRSNQNKELYETIGTNARYADISDVTSANAIDLSTRKNYKTREGYHQLKEYQEVVPMPRVKKELEEFNNLYQNRENKIYDINNVLEEARKNRIEKDELEEKRKLKNTSYNILASLNKEELEKYKQEKHNKVIHPDEDELRELIDTITSKTLAGDIKAASSLLSDLMATSIMEKVNNDPDDLEENIESESEEKDEDYQLSLSKEILDLEQLKKINNIDKNNNTEDKASAKIMSDADEDFYTRSMDLSDQDFELDDEFKEKKMPIGIKLLILLIILVVLAAVIYFIKKSF